jgi:hypothetical protein
MADIETVDATTTLSQNTNKPLPGAPSGRPGTSGTELNLRVNRQKAQTSYQRAQRAEQAYRAKRRATNARKDIQNAKDHFKTAGTSLKNGTMCAWAAVRAGPAVLREMREKQKKEKEEKEALKAEEVRFSIFLIYPY